MAWTRQLRHDSILTKYPWDEMIFHVTWLDVKGMLCCNLLYSYSCQVRGWQLWSRARHSGPIRLLMAVVLNTQLRASFPTLRAVCSQRAKEAQSISLHMWPGPSRGQWQLCSSFEQQVWKHWTV